MDPSHLNSLTSLEVLDLSRNNLVKLSPGTFVGLTDLRYLDVGVNSLRTVCIFRLNYCFFLNILVFICFIIRFDKLIIYYCMF